MALINCPECGKENVSSSASSCPNCGFDLKSWQEKLNREKEAEDKERKAQENLRLKKEKELVERQKIIDTIPDPTPYGKVWVYVVIGVVGILFTIGGGFFWFVAALIGCGVYWYISNRDYKVFIEDEDAYRMKKAASIESAKAKASSVKMAAPSTVNEGGTLFCPKCGSEDITKQVFQENKGSETITHTTSKYKEAGHGIIWWILIGWWWWIVDLCLWIFAFFPRLILRLFAAPFKRKKYKGKSTSVAKTVNDISYRTICTCQKCGHTW